MFFVFIGLCSFSLFLPNSGHSELIQTINIRVVARVTTQVSTNDGTRSERMKTVRITTKEILEMLGRATSNDFHGATLVCVHRGAAYQVRRGTNVLADVSEFFIDESASADVIDQDFNSTTGKDNYHGFWMRALTFDDQQGNRFTLNGLLEERYTAKSADSQGLQEVSDIENLNGAGTGTLVTEANQEGEFALFSGAIILSGKGVVPLNSF
jgi:hypothetical protein